MSERFRIPLTFGSGLDRASGRTAVRPDAMRDLRNVYLLPGKALVRRGMSETAAFSDEGGVPLSHILGIHPQRTLREGLVVGYQAEGAHAGKVYIYRVTALGTDPQPLTMEDGSAFWFELPEGAHSPPRLVAADTYGKVFFAHDEPDVGRRAPTVYYDGYGATELNILRADFDGSGVAPVKFRSVVRHLSFLVGSGFGAATTDRPEMVRTSLEGEPTVFERDDYALAGQRGEPVLACVSCNAGLVVLKESDAYILQGQSKATFGIFPLDPTYGVVSARLAIPFDGGVIFWSAEGPRWTDGRGPSIDLALPLDLMGMEPGSLIASGAAEDGFVVELPSRRIVEFIFGRRGYALSYQTPNDPKWSYTERGVPVYCAGTLYLADGQSATLPPGYPKWEAISAPDDIQDFAVTLKMRHINPRAGDVAEVWLREYPSGAWARRTTVVVDTSVSIQSVRLTSGISPMTAYQGAFRYRSATLFSPGYEGATPDDWTAATASESIGTFATTGLARRLWDGIWSRIDETTHQVLLTWDSGPADKDTRVVKSTDSGSTWVPVAVVDEGLVQYAYAPAVGEEGTEVWFRVAATDGTTDGPWSAIVKTWIGPLAPLGYSADYSFLAINVQGVLMVGAPPRVSISPFYTDQWATVEHPDFVIAHIEWGLPQILVGATTEVQVDDDGTGFTTRVSAPASGPAPATIWSLEVARYEATRVRLQTKLVTGATVDYSRLTPERVVNTL
jgi:hypothetical protein